MTTRPPPFPRTHRPQYYYWRLVNITRKFSLVVCSTFFSRDPMLQASVAVAIMFLCYIIQAAKRPFIMRLPVSPAALARPTMLQRMASFARGGGGIPDHHQ